MTQTTLPPVPAAVAEVLKTYPPAMRRKVQNIRKLIFEAAAATDHVGPLTETLKWGEPAYLTDSSKSGTTIRVARKATKPEQFGLYFNCQTTLIGSFRRLYPDELNFEGNRSIVLQASGRLPLSALRDCITRALTYHRSK